MKFEEIVGKPLFSIEETIDNMKEVQIHGKFIRSEDGEAALLKYGYMNAPLAKVVKNGGVVETEDLLKDDCQTTLTVFDDEEDAMEEFRCFYCGRTPVYLSKYAVTPHFHCGHYILLS